MKPTGTRKLWVRVFLVAVGVHALVWLQYRSDPFAETYISDALSYHHWAQRIVENGLHAEPVFHQSPLFPLLLSWVYDLASVAAWSDWSIVLQILLGSAAVASLVPLGRLWLGSAPAGLAAAALALLHGPFVFYAMKLLPVSLALVTQAAGLALLALARRSGSLPWAVGAGAGWGVACLARSEMLLFVVPALAALWWPRESRTARSSGRRVVLPAAYLAGLALLILPATVHNTRRGDPVLLASSAGENLFIGNQRGATGGYTALHSQAGNIFSQRILAQRLAEKARARPLRPSEVSDYWIERTWVEVLVDPGAWLRLELRKLGRILHPGDPTDIYSFALERSLYLGTLHALPVTPWVLLLLGSVGLTIALSRMASQVWPLAALVAVHVTLLLVFFVDARLRLPLLFALCPFAGFSVVEAVRWWRFRRRRDVILLATLTVAALAVGGFATRPTPRDAVRLAAVLSMQQRLDASLGVLAPWLASATADPLVLDQAGWVLQKQGRYAESREHYVEALGGGLPPARERQTRTRLGQVLEQLGQLDDAAAQHEAAVSSAYANAGAYYERAMFRLRRNDRAGAVQDLREAVRLDGTWPAPRAALRSLAEAD